MKLLLYAACILAAHNQLQAAMGLTSLSRSWIIAPQARHVFRAGKRRVGICWRVPVLAKKESPPGAVLQEKTLMTVFGDFAYKTLGPPDAKRHILFIHGLASSSGLCFHCVLAFASLGCHHTAALTPSAALSLPLYAQTIFSTTGRNGSASPTGQLAVAKPVHRTPLAHQSAGMHCRGSRRRVQTCRLT